MNLYRSLFIFIRPDESFLKILELLAGEEFLQTNRQFICNLPGFQIIRELDCSRNSRFVELICLMKNLEELNLCDYELTPDDLAHVFHSCSKLTNLYVPRHKYKTQKMDEHLKNQLRSGFQRLRCLHLECSINSDTWPMIQEMLT
jgi:hypothetical protein